MFFDSQRASAHPTSQTPAAARTGPGRISSPPGGSTQAPSHPCASQGAREREPSQKWSQDSNPGPLTRDAGSQAASSLLRQTPTPQEEKLNDKLPATCKVNEVTLGPEALDERHQLGPGPQETPDSWLSVRGQVAGRTCLQPAGSL